MVRFPRPCAGVSVNFLQGGEIAQQVREKLSWHEAAKARDPRPCVWPVGRVGGPGSYLNLCPYLKIII